MKNILQFNKNHGRPMNIIGSISLENQYGSVDTESLNGHKGLF